VCIPKRSAPVKEEPISSMFAEQKEPLVAIKDGESVRLLLIHLFATTLQRRSPSEGIQRILAFAGHVCKWHPEQLTLAEFSAFAVRDVIAHIDLAAEAKVKQKQSTKDLHNVESDLDSGEEVPRPRPGQEIEIVDVGGAIMAGVEDDHDDVEISECSTFPITDYEEVLSMALQYDAIRKQGRRVNREQKQL